MGLLSTRFIQREIAQTANTVTVTEIARSTGSDEYRTVTETETDNASINCWIQVLTEEDESVKEGIARAGDLVFWFDSDQESIVLQGNRITWDSKIYQIHDVKKFDVGGTTYLIEARTRQI